MDNLRPTHPLQASHCVFLANNIMEELGVDFLMTQSGEELKLVGGLDAKPKFRQGVI